MKHVRQKCIDQDCYGDCYVCELFVCNICKGAEMELTYECCGQSLTEYQRAKITKGELDFYDGKWQEGNIFKDNQKRIQEQRVKAAIEESKKRQLRERRVALLAEMKEDPCKVLEDLIDYQEDIVNRMSKQELEEALIASGEDPKEFAEKFRSSALAAIEASRRRRL